MKSRNTLFAIATALITAGKAYAHHYDVMGMSIEHEMMFVPAAVVTALGLALLFGIAWKQKKALGTGLLLASLPLWYIGIVE